MTPSLERMLKNCFSQPYFSGAATFYRKTIRRTTLRKTTHGKQLWHSCSALLLSIVLLANLDCLICSVSFCWVSLCCVSFELWALLVSHFSDCHSVGYHSVGCHFDGYRFVGCHFVGYDVNVKLVLLSVLRWVVSFMYVEAPTSISSI